MGNQTSSIPESESTVMDTSDGKNAALILEEGKGVPYANLSSEDASLAEEEKQLINDIDSLQRKLDDVRKRQGKGKIRIAVPGQVFSHLSQDQSEHVTDEVFNAGSHFVALMLSILGTAYLVAQASYSAAPWAIIGFSVYGACMINLFISSTLHHGIHGSLDLNKRLRMLDFNAIYPMIAGTYTPICIVYLHGTVTGWVFLGSVWVIAIMGMALTITLFPDHLPKWVPFVIYVTMGWMSLFLVISVASYLGTLGLSLLVLGGIFYTVGGVIYTSEKPAALIHGHFGFHEIWHILVMLAAGTHYAMMVLCVLPES